MAGLRVRKAWAIQPRAGDIGYELKYPSARRIIPGQEDFDVEPGVDENR